MWWHWIRRQVRARMRPIEEKKANKWHNRLTFAYFGLAWTILGYAIFTFSTHNPASAPPERPGIYYSKLLNRDKVTIVRVNKFTVEDSFEYNPKEELAKEKMKKDEEFYGKKDDEELLE